MVGNRFTSLLPAPVDRDEARSQVINSGDEPVAAVVESARRQAHAFAATPPGQPVVGPKGNVPAAAFLRFRLIDPVVHAWDSSVPRASTRPLISESLST
ncbi:MAG TPA: maleylpyruvate isomerase N-terminal domain-containing protein [Mycobacterium sp.]|nr:maleylpyruvate isomerase N-terminal domain-containing protein [Mycobacterium sp.]